MNVVSFLALTRETFYFCIDGYTSGNLRPHLDATELISPRGYAKRDPKSLKFFILIILWVLLDRFQLARITSFH